jgi:hypothetical protein
MRMETEKDEIYARLKPIEDEMKANKREIRVVKSTAK